LLAPNGLSNALLGEMPDSVLERERRLQELRLARVVAVEVELRLLDGVLAQDLLERLDMRVLVVGDGLQEHARLGAREERVAALVCRRFVVERRLQVLQRQRVIQNPEVALAELRRRTVPGAERHGARRQRSEQRAPADHCAAGDARAAQELRARVAVKRIHRLGRGFRHCAADVDRCEVQLLAHVILPTELSVATDAEPRWASPALY
jgi:hypothetical protein